tara:strand:+ start:844 stop:1758 length:915 start_codon:yes stop_codon:yes gene_type:complete
VNIDFKNIKVLLIGDFMIDHYIMGTSQRMCPEAPVPVVKPEKEYSIPGGAGNVAMNLSLLGADVTCVGCVGDDIWGEKLLSILKNQGIKIDKINVIPDHPTTLKQRIYSDNKQVARIDTEKIINWQPDFQIKKNYDIIILSDYNKGVLNNLWFDISNFDNVIVDPKKDSFSHYKEATILTPNLNELKKASSIDINNNQSIVNSCKQLIKDNNFEYIVAKKGDRGMTIVGKDDFVKHIEACAVENPDVTGAGDTVIAVLSLFYYVTNDIIFSTNAANYAAGLIVKKAGTAHINLNELEQFTFINK